MDNLNKCVCGKDLSECGECFEHDEEMANLQAESECEHSEPESEDANDDSGDSVDNEEAAGNV